MQGKWVQKVYNNKVVIFLCPGNHPENSGHPQSALDVLFWPASQQQPVQRPGALAPPRYGRFPRQRKIWTTKWGVEVREDKSLCVCIGHLTLDTLEILNNWGPQMLSFKNVLNVRLEKCSTEVFRWFPFPTLVNRVNYMWYLLVFWDMACIFDILFKGFIWSVLHCLFYWSCF